MEVTNTHQYGLLGPLPWEQRCCHITDCDTCALCCPPSPLPKQRSRLVKNPSKTWARLLNSSIEVVFKTEVVEKPDFHV